MRNYARLFEPSGRDEVENPPLANYGAVGAAAEQNPIYTTGYRIIAVCTVLGSIIGICLSFTAISIGSVFCHDCPRQKYIPIYVIVWGCVSLGISHIEFIRRLIILKRGPSEENSKINPFSYILSFFLLIWIIVGSVWIYSIYGDFDETLNPSNPTHYCNPLLYYYAFWTTTVGWVFSGLLICCTICVTCTACIAG